MSFLRLFFVFLLRWHLLKLSFVPSLHLHCGQGSLQVQVTDEGGQGHGEGQEQDTGRLGGAAGAQADRQTRAVGARLGRQPSPGEAKWALRRGCALHALLMGLSKKLKLLCFFCPIAFVN